VVPDYFKGDPAPADLVNLADFSTWISRHPASEVDSIIDTTIKYMRGNLGVKKLGSVGYCFGGKYVARFLAKGKGLDAGFVAHPSLTEKAEYEAISGPFSMAFAGKIYYD
jgi:dienelactone hydrolase